MFRRHNEIIDSQQDFARNAYFITHLISIEIINKYNIKYSEPFFSVKGYKIVEAYPLTIVFSYFTVPN